jgi:hypothetical protein
MQSVPSACIRHTATTTERESLKSEVRRERLEKKVDRMQWIYGLLLRTWY